MDLLLCLMNIFNAMKFSQVLLFTLEISTNKTKGSIVTGLKPAINIGTEKCV